MFHDLEVKLQNVRLQQPPTLSSLKSSKTLLPSMVPSAEVALRDFDEVDTDDSDFAKRLRGIKSNIKRFRSSSQSIMPTSYISKAPQVKGMQVG